MQNTVLKKFVSFADVIMRIPPLLVIDELLGIGLGLPSDTIVLEPTESSYMISNVTDTICNKMASFTSNTFLCVSYPNQLAKMLYLIIILKFLCCCLGCVVALFIFTLWTKHLVIIYLYILSIGVIFLSYWSNVSAMKAVIAYSSAQVSTTSILGDILCLNFNNVFNEGPGLLVIQNHILQCFLAGAFCYLHFGPRYSTLQTLLVLSFVAPSILGIHPLPVQVLHHAPVFATLLPLAVCKFVIWYNAMEIFSTPYISYYRARDFIRNYGLNALVETEWLRLNVPCVLRTFWLLRMGEQLVQILGSEYGEESFSYYETIRTLLVNGCETLTSVLGMTSIISLICHYIGCFCQWVLLAEAERGTSFGTISAVLFYILCLQTGLTSLDSEKRFGRLCRNFCLLFTAVLHFIHNIVNPLLMSLSASHNPALHRHVRALTVCAFLIILPVGLLVLLWSNFNASTWLLAVSVFSVEVIVKVLVSLAIYSLFLIDAYRSTFWEQLDDCVYIIRSFGYSVEFIFGVILFFNGFWILVYESCGAIRAIMMCIHAYYNIWCEGKEGWTVYMKRRTAVNKINSLLEAKSEELKSFNDVCAICYQEMQTARITKCKHYFHGVCLRKWLYVQDRCPLCLGILYKLGMPPEDSGNEEHEGNVEERNEPENNVFRREARNRGQSRS